ncbi:hypothetical protein BATDEDRAFT_22045 [Batrachochytrium dendrobatidis JAM81]|uniref:Uncharacterized protein n=1 Tax=Batrachochytrium dendrobatidis (strain JAM81 / FGSC 10211) TaxID=684364 RepID=F4NS29_BATDJ|nr:uncharacterized protein BATDEDRAFT_22045 [Batrachochytrium dendrobatidis JAM81]EGF83388.1 hypothetical protein BATDEDRAFT_22045 [Batrachochytrium dendrobatidis JAM81]|eukprot:XP_006675454.1 hypothetical protein BATDEDRAFT_22045 [Batrachochytrium dendrobatidis JAM81]
MEDTNYQEFPLFFHHSTKLVTTAESSKKKKEFNWAKGMIILQCMQASSSCIFGAVVVYTIMIFAKATYGTINRDIMLLITYTCIFVVAHIMVAGVSLYAYKSLNIVVVFMIPFVNFLILAYQGANNAGVNVTLPFLENTRDSALYMDKYIGYADSAQDAMLGKIFLSVFLLIATMWFSIKTKSMLQWTHFHMYGASIRKRLMLIKYQSFQACAAVKMTVMVAFFPQVGIILYAVSKADRIAKEFPVGIQDTPWTSSRYIIPESITLLLFTLATVSCNALHFFGLNKQRKSAISYLICILIINVLTSIFGSTYWYFDTIFSQEYPRVVIHVAIIALCDLISAILLISSRSELETWFSQQGGFQLDLNSTMDNAYVTGYQY